MGPIRNNRTQKKSANAVGNRRHRYLAGVAMLTGDAEDLLFILYFETFPEQLARQFNPLDLLSRVPEYLSIMDDVHRWYAHPQSSLRF